MHLCLVPCLIVPATQFCKTVLFVWGLRKYKKHISTVAEVVNNKIAKMQLGLVVQGQKYGRSVGPAEELLDKLRGEVLFRTEYNRLNNHLKAVQLLQKSNSMPKVLAMPPDEYAALVDVFEKHDVKLDQGAGGKPAKNNVKEWLLVRRLNEITTAIFDCDLSNEAAAKGKLAEFWDSIRWWFVDAETPKFDLHCPRMRDVAADLPDQKSVRVLYRVLVKNFLVPMVVRGEEMAARLDLIARESLAVLDEVDTVALEKHWSDVVVTAEKLFTAVKVANIKGLTYTEPDLYALEQVMKSAQGKGRNALERFADALESSDYYSQIIKDILEKKASLLELSANFATHVSELEGLPETPTEDCITFITEFSKHICYFRENVGMDKIQDLVDTFFAHVVSINVAYSSASPGRIVADDVLAKLQNMFMEAQIALPEHDGIPVMLENVGKITRKRKVVLCM